MFGPGLSKSHSTAEGIETGDEAGVSQRGACLDQDDVGKVFVFVRYATCIYMYVGHFECNSLREMLEPFWLWLV